MPPRGRRTELDKQYDFRQGSELTRELGEEAAKSSIRLLLRPRRCMREICDDSQIPESFGGSNKDPERSEPERRLAAAMAA